MGGKKDISYFDEETQKCILNLARQMTKDALAKHIKKTWIVSKWHYTHDIINGKLIHKEAIRLYCPETDEYKEI